MVILVGAEVGGSLVEGEGEVWIGGRRFWKRTSRWGRLLNQDGGL